MKIAIIGAGTLGLTLAYRLSKARYKVTVFEARTQVGGWGTWFDYGDFIWDKFYHVILTQDSYFLRLIKEVGLASELQWKTTKTGFLWRGQTISMSNHWEFFTFPALSILEKIRLGLGILYSIRLKSNSIMENITAQDWLSQIFGNSVYESIWEPLLRSKFGVLRDKVPASFIWATILRYYSTRNSKTGKERMGYLRGGLKTFYEALSNSICWHGGEIVCNTPIVAIRNENQKVVLSTKDHNRTFDFVISTIPSHLLQAIVADVLDKASLSKHSFPYYLGVICLVLILRRSLSPFYLTNLIQKGFPFTGIVEMTNVVDKQRATRGYHLVFLPRYDVPNSEWFEKDPEEIKNRFLSSLGSVWLTIEQDIVRTCVHREKYFQPIWPPECHPKINLDSNFNGKIVSINAELIKQDTHNNNAIVKIANQAFEYLTLHHIK